MPIHEYQCAKCGKRFEYLARRKDDAPETCPHCGGRRLKKELSSFSVSGPGAPSCSTGSCPTCPTGSCPLG